MTYSWRPSNLDLIIVDIPGSRRAQKRAKHRQVLSGQQRRNQKSSLAVYPGTDPYLHPPVPPLRAVARAWLQKRNEKPLVVFVGTFGYDRNKGFDTLFAAW